MSLVIQSVDAVVKIEPIEGDFPDYTMLIPSNYHGSILFDNKTLAADVSKFKDSHILVSVADGKVVLRNSDDSVVLVSSSVRESSNNASLSFYVDPKLFEMALLSVDAPMLYQENKLRPLVFKNDLDLFLLMPMRNFY
jgi:DNA polymerase III sliding clamp (beta) subunit (PCNA family)